jgi:hypothetical protein
MVPYTDNQLNRFIRWLRSDRSANFRGQTGQDFLDALGFTDALQDVAQLSSTMRVRLVCVVACIAQNIGGWNPAMTTTWSHSMLEAPLNQTAVVLKVATIPLTRRISLLVINPMGLSETATDPVVLVVLVAKIS